jgi:hypothetical protein
MDAAGNSKSFPPGANGIPLCRSIGVDPRTVEKGEALVIEDIPLKKKPAARAFHYHILAVAEASYGRLPTVPKTQILTDGILREPPPINHSRIRESAYRTSFSLQEFQGRFSHSS